MNSTSVPSAPHFWIDQLNPWVFRLRDGLGVRWYGLAYIAGILIAACLLARWSRCRRIPLERDELDTFIAYAAAGVLVGGRLGYCVFYNWPQVKHDPLELFAVWHGGMSSHGGILGLILCVCIFAVRHKRDPWLLLDAVAVAGPLGIALGRMANFINGELWGRPTLVPWAVIFPRAPLINGVSVPRHPSQLYAAVLEGLFVFLVGRRTFRGQPVSGVATASVCLVYGIARFIDEFWREPDFGQPLLWHWMSKGQLLTLPLLAAGITILFIRGGRSSRDSTSLR